MSRPKLAEDFKSIINRAGRLAAEFRNTTFSLDHITLVLLEDGPFVNAADALHLDFVLLRRSLKTMMEDSFEKDESCTEPSPARAVSLLMEKAMQFAQNEQADTVRPAHLIRALACFDELLLSFAIEDQGASPADFYDRAAQEAEAEDTLLDENVRSFLEEVLPEHCADFVPRPELLSGIIRVLLRRERNNPLLIGEPGTGKASLASRGLLQAKNRNLLPAGLEGIRVFRLRHGALFAGTNFRGQLESRFISIHKTLSEIPGAVLLIEDLPSLLGTDARAAGTDISANLQDMLMDPSIRVIATACDDGYRRNIQNRDICHAFHPVSVPEPSDAQTVQILEGVCGSYESFHHVQYSTDALQASVELSRRFLRESFFPEKAIDLLDEAGACASMEGRTQVSRTDMEDLIARICRIPVSALRGSEKERLRGLEDELNANVFGQTQAAAKIALSMQISRAGLLEDNKPVASYLFVGQTGVGKTEVAKVLSQTMGLKLIRFDMSEYAESHSAAKLFGSPAGYVGYDDGGLLTNAVRKDPSCIVLFDEIEKAHPSIYNALLQIMDEATLTDSRGRKADFRSAVIIMTSNAGARESHTRKIGFDAGFHTSGMSNAVRETFSPEFIGRLTDVIEFNPLTEAHARQIAERQMNRLVQRLHGRSIFLEYDAELCNFVASRGYSPDKGARNISAVINREIAPLLMQEILYGKLENGGRARLSIQNENPVLYAE